MRRWFILVMVLSATCSGLAQDAAETAIKKILNAQTANWNKGDLEGFMQDYWNNDSLMFVGKTSVTYGFKNTLERYRSNYSNADKMGKLFFEILKISRLSNEYYFVLGKWFLKRNAGDVSGHYTLLMRKINGKWKIVSDHSS